MIKRRPTRANRELLVENRGESSGCCSVVAAMEEKEYLHEQVISSEDEIA